MPAGTTHLTAGVLGGVAGLHLAWGLGSSFPFTDRQDLAEAVIGRTTVPGPLPCVGVAAALLLATSVIEDRPVWPPPQRRLALVGVTGVLGLRGVLGLAGKTSVVSPGSDARRFRDLDRRFYGPLCVALAVGAFRARRCPGPDAAGVPYDL
jgi:Protein of unknown function (DUF3995)